MAMTEKERESLEKTVDGLIAQDLESASASFHDFMVSKSSAFMEGDCCPEPAGGKGIADPKDAKGDASVKATMKKTGDAEIKKTGESKNDPKDAKGDASVKATMKKGSDAEIPKKGESKDDPKKAKGDPGVKATMASAGKKEIK